MTSARRLRSLDRVLLGWRPSASGSRPTAPGRSGWEVSVTSTIIVRSSRLRSRSGWLLGSPQFRAGRARAPRGVRAMARARAWFCSVSSAVASASSCSLCSHRVSRLRATSRFSGSQAWNARSARIASYRARSTRSSRARVDRTRRSATSSAAASASAISSGASAASTRRAISSSTTVVLTDRHAGVLMWSAREWPHS